MYFPLFPHHTPKFPQRLCDTRHVIQGIIENLRPQLKNPSLCIFFAPVFYDGWSFSFLNCVVILFLVLLVGLEIVDIVTVIIDAITVFVPMDEISFTRWTCSLSRQSSSLAFTTVTSTRLLYCTTLSLSSSLFVVFIIIALLCFCMLPLFRSTHRALSIA